MAKTPEKAQVIENFVKYIITKGQSEAAKLSYAGLPPALQQRDETLIAGAGSQGGEVVNAGRR